MKGSSAVADAADDQTDDEVGMKCRKGCTACWAC